MLQKNDLVILLTEMESNGIADASKHIKGLLTGAENILDAVRFVNEHRQLDVAMFYDRIRKNHNEKKSNLYKNIIKDAIEPQEALITLHAFALQSILYSKHVDERSKGMFFKHVRSAEVTEVLNRFYKDYDIDSAMKMLRLIKSDLMAFEYISGRRALK